MISKFVFRNLTSGKETTMGQDAFDGYVYKSGGVDWGSVPGAHSTYSYPGQVGVSVSGTKLNTREVTIEGYVHYVLTSEEVRDIPRADKHDYVYGKIKEKKRFLNEVINPNDFVRLTIGNYFIEGKPESSVVYGKDEDDNNEYFCKFMFSLLCANPMFRKVSNVKTVLSGDVPYFHFDWVIPEEGYVFGMRTAYSLLVVENEGDVPVGGKITLRALGEVERPKVENIGTGETITVMKTLQRDEVVVIDTTDGPSKGIYGGSGDSRENYFKYWSLSNSWFKFQQGSTLIGYSTQNSSDSLLEVSVDVNPEKFNLEEM